MLYPFAPKIVKIFTTPSAGPNPPPAGGYSVWNKPIETQQAKVIFGKGIVGDRFFGVSHFKMFNGELKPFLSSRNVSFIGLEILEKIYEEYGILVDGLRRNFVTKGLNVESLVDKKFRVGNIQFIGVEPCKGCKHIEDAYNSPGLIKILLQKGGIRAKVLSNGFIRVGDKFYI